MMFYRKIDTVGEDITLVFDRRNLLLGRVFFFGFLTEAYIKKAESMHSTLKTIKELLAAEKYKRTLV